MDKISAKAERIIRRYRNELERMGIKVTGAYLYGSYARGTPHAGSDIDLVVISKDFEAMGLLKRMELLGLAAGHLREPVQAYGFTPDEVEKGLVPPFLADVLEHEAVAV